MEPGAIIIFAVGGVLLVLCEIFIPGGIVGTIGGIMLAVSIVAAFLLNPALGVVMLFGSVFFGIFALWAWVKFLPRTSIGRRFILQSDGADWDGFDKTKSALLGKQGLARTALRPGGVAVIDGKRIDVVSRGDLIDVGTEVKVVEVEGNRVVVAPA